RSCTLLYRRFAICEPRENPNASESFGTLRVATQSIREPREKSDDPLSSVAPQNAILRYSRLKICATNARLRWAKSDSISVFGLISAFGLRSSYPLDYHEKNNCPLPLRLGTCQPGPRRHGRIQEPLAQRPPPGW